ncbi:MAG TPA: HU family DNA-binding protein [bacterium]|nr:HU family DNA-binding protein [bacterium]
MTRRKIVQNLNKIGLTKNQADAAVDTFFNKIIEALKEQKKVSIVGFGTWEWRDRKSRMARNPKTGKAVALGTRKALVFKPSQMLKNKLKG